MNEKLEKRSKNVRDQTRNISPQKAHERIMGYLQRQGLRTEYTARGKRMGFGVDDNGQPWVRGDQPHEPMMDGSVRAEQFPVAHEAGHMLMTPEGQSFDGYQKELNDRKYELETPNWGHKQEYGADLIEHGIHRRAGVQPKTLVTEKVSAKPSGYPVDRNFHNKQQRPVMNQFGRPEQAAFDEGRKVIGPEGKMVAGTSVDAKINARAARMGKSENMAKKEAFQWNGRPVTAAEHVPMLEHSSAAAEMGEHKLPKTEAEKKAYDDYIKDQREDAASWHLMGLKASRGAGDDESAQKHYLMYAMHCQALGHEPVGAPHPSIVARMLKHPDKLYRFKAHKGDLFALPDGDKGAQEPTQMDKSEKMKKHEIGHALLKTLVEVLKKNDDDDDFDDDFDFDGAQARYWWLAHHHEGQGSPQYAELSELANSYQPGAIEKGPNTDESKSLYDQMCADHGCQHQPLVPHQLGVMDGGSENPGGPPAQLRVVKSETRKTELKAAAKKSTCRCAAYTFPHRHKGGACKGE